MKYRLITWEGILVATLFLWGCASPLQATQAPVPPTGTNQVNQPAITPTVTQPVGPPTAPPTGSGQDVQLAASPTAQPTAEPLPTQPPISADVLDVQASGEPNAYQFSVTIFSPDQGCQQYADWWEVLNTDGELLYRRILLHSHTDEQPFTRQGGPVPIAADTVVWVRAHMNTGGYGGTAFTGSVQDGFQQADPGADFAPNVEEQPPLPEGCAF